MNDLCDTCQPDGAADRAASAARTLAAIAHDAARKHVKRNVVAPQADRRDPLMVPYFFNDVYPVLTDARDLALDDAERERQNRLRRWQALPYPNRKGG
jgi:hypothetical protein